MSAQADPVQERGRRDVAFGLKAMEHLARYGVEGPGMMIIYTGAPLFYNSESWLKDRGRESSNFS